jgi:hypothetical protein
MVMKEYSDSERLNFLLQFLSIGDAGDTDCCFGVMVDAESMEEKLSYGKADADGRMKGLHATGDTVVAMIDKAIAAHGGQHLRYLKVVANVRYPEDAEVNGVEDVVGKLMPFMKDKTWSILIDLSSGTIVNWPKGVTASTHYKVCDDGKYWLLNEARQALYFQGDYVPPILSVDRYFDSDYIAMEIDGDGVIANWLARHPDIEKEIGCEWKRVLNWKGIEGQ